MEEEGEIKCAEDILRKWGTKLYWEGKGGKDGVFTGRNNINCD